MNILELYIFITYLYALGFCIASFSDAKKDRVLSGMFLTFVFAPIIIPIIKGMIFLNKNYNK